MGFWQRLFGVTPLPLPPPLTTRDWGGHVWVRREGWSGWWLPDVELAQVLIGRRLMAVQVNMGYGMNEPGYTGIEAHAVSGRPPWHGYRIVGVCLSPEDSARFTNHE